MILDQIYEEKQKQLIQIKKKVPMSHLAKQVRCKHRGKSFSHALTSSLELSIIGEVKKASPSKGIIRQNFNAKSIIKEYHQSTVAAISILTESTFFMGDKAYLPIARQLTDKPLLRKDFIIDPYQILESKVLGADALLLIVAGMSQDQLVEFLRMTEGLGMEALVEVHDQAELRRALEAGASLVGINNRNLQTFEVDLSVTTKLMKDMPDNIVVVSESGVYSQDQMEQIKSLGVDGVLIGETFMRGSTINEQIDRLRGKR